MNDKPNLVKELSPEYTAKLEAAIAAGATHARFTYADGSFHPYPIEKSIEVWTHIAALALAWNSQSSNHKRKAGELALLE